MTKTIVSLSLILLMAVAAWAEDALHEDPAAELLEAAVQAAGRGERAEAVKLAGQALARNPRLAAGYYVRGREHFRLGKIQQAVADFDKYVELRPEAESRQWERGIAYYYAGQYERGAEQFALYQTFHDNDVENAVWRYLCMARGQGGLERARDSLLPIRDDRRVPMMQIYDLFRGKLQPDDVFQAARAGEPPEAALRPRLFYAHLYVGLYYEAHGQTELAERHIRQAADKYRIGHYMGDVARVHAQRLEGDQ